MAKRPARTVTTRQATSCDNSRLVQPHPRIAAGGNAAPLGGGGLPAVEQGRFRPSTKVANAAAAVSAPRPDHLRSTAPLRSTDGAPGGPAA